MKKNKINIRYVCQTCGYSAPRWLGRCPECESWNSFLEERTTSAASKLRTTSSSEPVLINEELNQNPNRILTNNVELDTVLGNGLVEGSVILLGGDPGIGKSTLALQIFKNIENNDKNILYVSGEESVEQINLRAKRIGSLYNNLYLLAETNLENILDKISKLSVNIVVIDSIQTIFHSEFSSSPGSVSQIRECATKLVQNAKATNTVYIIIAHVTKEGNIAGPRVLEHLVDTVLYFEGGKGHPYRILRAWKNRFGATNEIGVFEMQHNGLIEVKNPSEIFLSERPENAPGSVVSTTIKGTRPILVEIQSLVSNSNYGMPRRTTIGLDSNKVALLIAVIEKIANINITPNDIFMKVAGGVSVDEPAIDLAICLSLYSSYINKPIDPELIIFGEVGLSGEIRGVSQSELRIEEAAKLGFKKCLLPNSKFSKSSKNSKIVITEINNIKDAIEFVS